MSNKEDSGYPKEEILGGEYLKKSMGNLNMGVAVEQLSALEEKRTKQGFGEKILFIKNEDDPNEIAIKVWRRLGDITDGKPAYKPYERKRVLVKFDDLTDLTDYIVNKVPEEIEAEKEKLEEIRAEISSINERLENWSSLADREKKEFGTDTMRRLLELANKFPQEYAREELKIEARNLIREAADLKDSRGQINPPASRSKLVAAIRRIGTRIDELGASIFEEFEAKKEDLERIVRDLKARTGKLYKLALDIREEPEGGVVTKKIEEFIEEFNYIKEVKVKPYDKQVQNITRVLKGKFTDSLTTEKVVGGFDVIIGSLNLIFERLNSILKEIE